MGRRGNHRRIAKNVYADAAGIRTVAGAAGLSQEQRYPHGTKLSVIRTWQRDTEAELRKVAKTTSRGTLTDDMPEYFKLVQETLASFNDRERDVRAWLSKFGHRRRATLRTQELDLQLRHWRNVAGLSASS